MGDLVVVPAPPPPFGLHNAGNTCYANSVLQALSGLYPFALLHEPQTATAVEFRRLAELALSGRSAEELAACGGRVVAALRADLQRWRPQHAARVGGGAQQSASEFLTMLVDMLDGVPRAEVDLDAVARSAAPVGWATRLLQNRVRHAVICAACRREHAVEHVALWLEMFHVDGMRAPPATPEQWAAALATASGRVDEYKCPTCAAITKNESVRLDTLVMVPEVLVCLFNIYGPARARERYLPPAFRLRAAGGAASGAANGGATYLNYRLAAQVEHYGSLGGGHYVALAERGAERAAYAMSDASVSSARLKGTRDTYIAVYHYSGPSA